MKQKKLALASLFIWGIFQSVFYATPTSLENVIQGVLKRPLYEDVKVGIQVRELKNGKSEHVILSHNPQKKFIPASTVKLIVSAAALKVFSSNHYFQTEVGISGRKQKDTLVGDLILIGKGDPGLKLETYNQIIKKLKKLRIRKVSGNIIFNTSYYKNDAIFLYKYPRYYYAPDSALTMNLNQVSLKPSFVNGGSLDVIPESSYVKLDVNADLIDTLESSGGSIIRIEQSPNTDTYKISGIITRADYITHNLNLAVSRPALFAATILKEQLEKNGIEVMGKVLQGDLPKRLKVISRLKSEPLYDSLITLNQNSNNVIAKLLVKNIGIKTYGKPGTVEKGLDYLKQFLKEDLNITSNIELKDAAGLSRDNRVTPESLSQILTYIATNKKLRRHILPSLIHLGYHSMFLEPEPPEYLDVFLKTGTLSSTGVNTVAGYIFNNQTKKEYSFVIMAQRMKPGEKTYTGTLTNPILIEVMKAL